MWHEDDLGSISASEYYGCSGCMEKEDLMDRCKRLTYDIVLSMHGKKITNIYAVDDLLEELCDCLGVKNPNVYEITGGDSANAG